METSRNVLFINRVIFFGFIVSSKDMSDPQKDKTIVEWPEPKNIHDIQSFMGLLSFTVGSSKDLVPSCPPLTDYMKQGRV
jgi:hypothetical protein